MKECALCHRSAKQTHGHHLIPRKFMRSRNTRDYILKYQENPNRKADLCVDCNKMVHALFSLKELAKHYNTIDKLRDSKKVHEYLSWVRSRPVGVIHHPVRSWKGGKYD